MKTKKEVRSSVRLVVFILPIAVIMIQLFFVAKKINKLIDEVENTHQVEVIVNPGMCYYE